MSIDSKKLKLLVNKVRIEKAQLEEKYLLSLAWDLLQEKDEDGLSKGALPYTLKAINALRTAYRNNPDSIGIAHHLAISYHAYAWDLEIANDSRAEKFWRLALEFWRKVISSGQFWRDMQSKMIECDNEISEDTARKHVENIRKNLYENLLDIHVGFITYYHECGCMDRASIHVTIVNTAQIPPAVSYRLMKQVYGEMTRSLPESLNAGDYISALKTVESFHDMFPGHIESLVTYMEIAKKWLHSCSYMDNWNTIVDITKSIKPYTEKLILHDDFSSDPTARIGLADMVKEIFYHSFDRTQSLLPQENSEITVANRDAAMDSFMLAIEFGRIAYPSAPNGHEITKMLPVFLRNYVFCIDLKFSELIESKTLADNSILSSVSCDLLEEAIKYMEESLSYEYNERASQELEQYKELLGLLQLKGSVI